MTNVLPFSSKADGLTNLRRCIDYLRGLILGEVDKTLIFCYSTEALEVTVQYLCRSYEEERLRMFSNNRLMTAPALSSMVCLTPHVFRDEVVEISAVEIQLWNNIPHVEHFVTAHSGGFEYNFRGPDHDIAQVTFQLKSYDRRT